jgi:hypothetical protein
VESPGYDSSKDWVGRGGLLRFIVSSNLGLN